MKRFWIILCVLCLTASPALAEGKTARITAVGSASVTLEAETADLSLHVQAMGKTVTEAQALAEAELDKLKAALLEAGVAEEDITLGQADIQTQYQFQYTRLEEQQVLAGYQVTASMTVCVRQPDVLGAVIDAAVAGGAQSDYTLTCQSTRTEKAYAQALAQAVQNAQLKAQTMAEAAGLTLDQIVTITETAPTPATQTGAFTLRVDAEAQVCYGVR